MSGVRSGAALKAAQREELLLVAGFIAQQFIWNLSLTTMLAARKRLSMFFPPGAFPAGGALAGTSLVQKIGGPFYRAALTTPILTLKQIRIDKLSAQ